MEGEISSDRSIHIVQIGYDDSVYAVCAPSDTLQRQVCYGRELAKLQPGSLLTLVSLTSAIAARRFEVENVVFVPVYGNCKCAILFRLLTQLATLHQQRPIDVVATQTIHYDGWIALAFGVACHVPVVGQVHYDLFSEFARRELFENTLLGRVRYGVGFHLIPAYAAIRVVNHRTCQRMLARRIHSNVHVIPVPVTMVTEDDSAVRTEMPRRHVLFVGRLVAVKNLGDWMQVAARVIDQEPMASFEIVGDGPLRSELELTAWQLGIAGNVTFRGAVAYRELRGYYHSAAVLLMTSQYEGFGRVVVEAYLHGVPVVSTQTTGVEDIVDNGRTGFVHPVGDIEGMATSLLRLLQDDPLRRQMGLAGRDIVRERFDPHVLSRRWMELLVAVARGRG